MRSTVSEPFSVIYGRLVGHNNMKLMNIHKAISDNVGGKVSGYVMLALQSFCAK
jgi:hypothetical protein